MKYATVDGGGTPEGQFFAVCRERYRVLLRRREGLPWPWTEDPILRRYRFCNVFREDDRTTEWVREHVRSLDLPPSALLDAVVIARWFNRIETMERLAAEPALLRSWDSDEARVRLGDLAPLVTGAFMVKTPPGMSKLEGLIWCVEHVVGKRVLPDPGDRMTVDMFRRKLERGSPAPTMEEACNVLQCYPFLGGFMAYEVACDLRHTPLMGAARDVMTWANPGPGALRGAGWVRHGDPRRMAGAGAQNREEVMGLMRHLVRQANAREDYWPVDWPRWEMREAEHSLCEFDKYMRAKHGQALKRRYDPPGEVA